MSDLFPDEQAAIDQLCTALSTYLAEVEANANMCLRHEQDAAVRGSKDLFHVRRAFPDSPALLAVLKARLQGMRGGGKRSALARELEERTRLASMWQRPGLKDYLHQGVACDGMAMVVHVWRSAQYKTVIVEIVAYRSRGDLPETPLHHVAVLLGCHEQLVPRHDFQVEPGQRGTHWKSPREFLLERLVPGTAAYQSVLRII